MRVAPFCDICYTEGPVNDLNPDYRTDGINQLCDGCLREVNNCHGEVVKMQHKMLHSLVQRFMLALRRKKGGGNG